MNKEKIIFILGIMFAVLISGCMQLREKKESAAVVNGVEISKDEFVQRLVLQSQSGVTGLEQMANETRDEFIQRLTSLIGKPVLEYMAIEIIIRQKAKEQKVNVEQEEIDAKIDEIKNFAQKLSESGMTVEEVRQQFESQILMEKLVLKQITVSEEEIKDHFERYKTNFAKPEEIKASHILSRTEEEAKEILSQLKAGADFVELAKEKSTDPITKDKGGDLGFFSRGKMTPAFERAAFALGVGEISDVVATPYGYHIIRVEEKKPAQEASLELAREEINKTITQQKIWTKRSTFLEDIKKEAKIKIMLPELRGSL